MARESKVVCGERAIRCSDVAIVVGDGRVKSDMVTRGAAKIVAEESEAGMELLEDDGLGLNFADLLGDDPFSHLLQHE